jgi:hypothetical protein
MMGRKNNFSRSIRSSQYSTTPVFQYSVSLYVAHQAVIGHFRCGVAVHAPLHRHLHPWPARGFFTLADIPVTLLAFKFPQRDMAPVREEDVIWLAVKMFPGNFFSSFLKFPNFLFLSALGEWVFVALQAGG